jgi:predicted alpha/beta superfamily hydrolase
LNFIEKELKPEVQRYIDIDRKKADPFWTLSWRAFFLNTLFTNSTLFQTYIAGSPSIHWDKELF